MNTRPGQNEKNKRDCFLKSHPWAKAGEGIKAGELLANEARARYDKIMQLSNARSESKRIRKEKKNVSQRSC